MTKFYTFNTLWKKAQEYVAFDETKYTRAYNCFMWALEENAKKVEGDDFDPKAFNYFLLSWRWNAQQAQLNRDCSIRQLCLSVYEAYTLHI
ncbi:hypothetical protein AWB71_05255 [Caballeronia peredens]|nr:hypothetical protein AWB71_05255 [Caballeronia peredens]